MIYLAKKSSLQHAFFPLEYTAGLHVQEQNELFAFKLYSNSMVLFVAVQAVYHRFVAH